MKYTVSAPAGLSATIEDDLLEVASTADANSLSSIQVTADNDDGIGSMTRTINLYVQGGKSSIFDISADIADDSLTVYSVYNLSGMFVGNSKDNRQKVQGKWADCSCQLLTLNFKNPKCLSA